MSYGRAQARYASDATQTASPARLLTMLYDRLVVDLSLGQEAMLAGDLATAGSRIGHACEIILELHSTLDTTVWREGEALAALYIWLLSELMGAQIAKDAERIRQCRDLVVPLRDAWHAAGGGAVSAEGAA